MTPVAICMRKPQYPEANDVSVTVICQPVGSVVPVCQAFAYNVLPTARKRKVYDVPAVAVKDVDPRMVVDPATFFCTTSWVPLI